MNEPRIRYSCYDADSGHILLQSNNPRIVWCDMDTYSDIESYYWCHEAYVTGFTSYASGVPMEEIHRDHLADGGAQPLNELAQHLDDLYTLFTGRDVWFVPHHDEVSIELNFKDSFKAETMERFW